MLFNSYIFVLLFLPVAVSGYFLLNRSNRYILSKIFLIGMSLWFYAYFNVQYLSIILSSIFFNYGINLCFRKANALELRRLILFLGLFGNAAVLFYFKYFDFFIQNINAAFQTDFQLRHIILPLGISFFTFQQLSYVVDSYKREVPAYHFLDYMLFVAFFPQLIAGPIVTHSEIVPQFADKSKKNLNYDNLSKGIMAFSFGLAKKVLIADVFGNAVNWGYDNLAVLDAANAAFIMFAYTIQIYFDFSGYCDMATGIGLMFNIDIPINFNSPYRALTIIDFWKRWHMTLTRFFTRYIYIPLGGSRKGQFCTYRNIFVVFLVSGLWHGANWTFVLWGILHGAANILSRIFSKRIEKWHPAFNWLLTFGFINVSWVYFRSPSVTAANSLLKKILTLNFGPLKKQIIACYNLTELQAVIDGLKLRKILAGYPLVLPLVFCLFAIYAILIMRNTNERIRDFKPTTLNAFTTVLFLLWSVLSFSGVSTFLYFNF